MKLPRPRSSLREYLAAYEREHQQIGTRLTHMLGIPMLVAAVPLAFFRPRLALGLGVTGAALQYLGHYAFEGNQPAFHADPYNLLVGPVWAAAEWLDVLGLPVPRILQPGELPAEEPAEL